MNRNQLYLSLLLALTALCSGCRRDLWVYTDEFRQVRLNTDWSLAEEHPSGMTWWFMNDNNSGYNRHETTAEVYHTWLNLPRGRYTGVVFDYSPAEYGHQEFLGMTHPDSALVHLRDAADQPRPDDNLYGRLAVAATGMEHIPTAANGMHFVAAEPEMMHADTLRHVSILTGSDSDLIPWDDRDDYEGTLTTQELNAEPKPIVWRLRVRVYVHGINYMYSVKGSVSGLADGCWLGTLRHTSTPCLQALDAWELHRVSDDVGYIATTVNTFGLPDLGMPASTLLTHRPDTITADARTALRLDTRADGTPIFNEHLRLNLQFLLRDQATVLNYHFDVGTDCITVYEDQLVVRIDIPIDYTGGPVLPYVDVKGSAGFGAIVTPWQDQEPAEVTM